MNKKNQNAYVQGALFPVAPLVLRKWPEPKFDLKNNRDLSNFLNQCITRSLHLDKYDFERFTAPDLSEDYFYQKWKSNEEDFSRTFPNMDKDNQERFLVFVLGTQDLPPLSVFFFNQFCMFVNTFNSSKWVQNPFTGRYARTFTKLATGRNSSTWISGAQVFTLFKKLPTDGKQYLTWCAFGGVKEVVS